MRILCLSLIALLATVILIFPHLAYAQSGTTTGGTATTSAAQALGPNENRRGFIVQNKDPAVYLYAACAPDSTGITTGTSHLILPQGNWEQAQSPCLDSIWVLTASGSVAWSATDY